MCNWTCRFELCTGCSSHHCQLPLNPREEESASLVFTRIMWRRRFSTLSWFCSVNVKQAKLFFNNDLSLWWCHPLTWLCLHNITNYIYNYINYYIIIVINCRHVSKELKLFIIRVGTAGNISLYFPVALNLYAFYMLTAHNNHSFYVLRPFYHFSTNKSGRWPRWMEGILMIVNMSSLNTPQSFIRIH